MDEIFDKWAASFAAALSMAVLIAAVTIWADVRALKQWHVEHNGDVIPRNEFLLEKQLLQLEHEQMRTATRANAAEIDVVKMRVSELEVPR